MKNEGTRCLYQYKNNREEAREMKYWCKMQFTGLTVYGKHGRWLPAFRPEVRWSATCIESTGGQISLGGSRINAAMCFFYHSLAYEIQRQTIKNVEQLTGNTDDIYWSSREMSETQLHFLSHCYLDKRWSPS